MELPEPTARNALLLLGYLLERERHPELGLPEIPEISKVIGLTHHETSDLIDILDSKGAIKANRSIAGGAAPMLTGHGKLMIEVLSESFIASLTRPRFANIAWVADTPSVDNWRDTFLGPCPKSLG